MGAGFGNIPPFFTNYGAASATSPGILTTSAQTKAGVMTFQDGVVFGSFSVTGATTATALTETIQGTTDTGTNPLQSTNYRIGASSAVATRPLWRQLNNGANLLALFPGRLVFGNPGTPAGSFHVYDTSASIVVETTSTYSYKISPGVSGFIGSDNGTPLDLRCNGVNLVRLGITGVITHNGGQVQKTRVALTTPVTVAVSDWYVESNLSVAGAVAVNLPASPTAGQEFVIADGKGDAGTNTITITPAAGNIDGAATKTITTNYGAVRLIYNGTLWKTI